MEEGQAVSGEPKVPGSNTTLPPSSGAKQSAITSLALHKRGDGVATRVSQGLHQ